MNNLDVVVLGHWNLGILSPQWIATSLLGVPEGKSVPVLVTMDYARPNRIQHEELGIEVRPYADRLHIVSINSKYAELENAMRIAVTALEILPLTPVAAAGFNVKLHADELSAELLASLSGDIDTPILKEGLTITSRHLSRKCSWLEGEINLSVTTDQTAQGQIGFNFHLGSSDKKALIAWLNQPISAITTLIESIIINVYKCTWANGGNNGL